VVVDLSHLPEVALDFPLLVGLLRGLGLLPIGVRGGSEQHRETARLMDLAILSQGSRGPAAAVASKAGAPRRARRRRRHRAGGRTAGAHRCRARREARHPPGAVGAAALRPGRGPGRAGARQLGGGAHGRRNIHVYGVLRGRALAGVKGNSDARIFCQDLRAELISVAGHYRVSENLDPALAGRPVQVSLQDGRLIIEAL